jgi:hypothetical protein
VSHVPFFYGLQPRWCSWDRLYKLHLAPDGVAGAYLSGQVYDDASGGQLVAPAQALGPLMAMWVRRILRKRAEREDRYESLITGSPEFLAADERNFLLKYADVERVMLSAKRARWTAGLPNSGSIRFHLWTGQQRRFILIGAQDVARLEELLVGALGRKQVERSA